MGNLCIKENQHPRRINNKSRQRQLIQQQPGHNPRNHNQRQPKSSSALNQHQNGQNPNQINSSPEINILKDKLMMSERTILDYNILYKKLIIQNQRMCTEMQNIDRENKELQYKISNYQSMQQMQLQSNEQKEILIEDEIKELDEEIEKEKKEQLQSERLRGLYHYTAIKHKQNQQYHEALTLLHQELQLCLQLQQAQTIVHAEVLFQFAQNHRLSGSFQPSLNLYQQALTIFKNIQSQSNQVARTLNGIGLLYFSQNSKNDKALDHYQQSLRINRKVVGNEHKDVGENIKNIGEFLRKQDLYRQAINKYIEALAVYENKANQMSEDYAYVYFSLAECYFKIQQFQEGINAYYEAFLMIKILKLWALAMSKQKVKAFKSDVGMMLSEKLSTYILKRCVKLIEQVFGKEFEDKQMAKLMEQVRQKIEQ